MLFVVQKRLENKHAASKPIVEYGKVMLTKSGTSHIWHDGWFVGGNNKFMR